MTIKCLTYLPVLLFLLAACERDFSARPSASDLCFSADTLYFGTVLPHEGSPTGYVTLLNVGGDDVTIQSIELAGGTSSPFNVNINGVPTTSLSDVRLRHSDSLYVFVSLKPSDVLPDRAVTTRADEVIVRSESNSWRLTLLADVLNVVNVSGVLPESTTWAQDSMYYYVSDTLTVPSGASLTLSQGVCVLMAPGAQIMVDGDLRCNGNLAGPVSFGGVRSEEFYEDIPGQWGGVRVNPGGQASFRMAYLTCCDQCLVADSAATLSADALIVSDASHAGITLRHADATISNSLIINCGGGGISMVSSSLSLTHSTLSLYYQWDYRRHPALSVSAADSTSPCHINVRNSIIVGNLTDEIIVDSVRKAAPDALFSHSLVRVAKANSVESDTVMFAGCKVAKDAKFADRSEYDFHLKPESDAVGTADVSVSRLYPADIEGAPRPQGGSSQMGAFESIAWD